MTVTRTDRRELEAIVADRSAPQKHVWRAHIILATAEGCGTAEIMRRSGKSKPAVWRWQARFMAEGVDGLTRDKTRISAQMKPKRQLHGTGERIPKRHVERSDRHTRETLLVAKTLLVIVTKLHHDFAAEEKPLSRIAQ